MIKDLLERIAPGAIPLFLAASVLLGALGLVVRHTWRAFRLNARIDDAHARATAAQAAADSAAKEARELGLRVGKLEGMDMAHAAELAALSQAIKAETAALRADAHEARRDQREQLASMGRTLVTMVEGVLALVRRDPEWTAAMREAEARARDLQK